MSISFTQYPDGISFIGSRLGNFTTFTSTNATGSNFVYQVKVVDSGSTQLAEFVMNPFPAKYSYKGQINTSDILYTKLQNHCEPTCSYITNVGNDCLYEYNIRISGSLQTGSSYLLLDSASLSPQLLFTVWENLKYYTLNGCLDYVDSKTSIPTTGTTIYIYYDNPSPPSDGYGSSGTNTFQFFDDFFLFFF